MIRKEAVDLIFPKGLVEFAARRLYAVPVTIMLPTTTTTTTIPTHAVASTRL